VKLSVEYPENDLDQIEKAIVTLSAEIDAAVYDKEVLRQYEDCKVKIAEVKVDLMKLSEDYDNAERSLEMRLQSWISRVESVASKLNVSFSKFMEKLGYRGEVVLRTTGSISEYGE
jgi:chromosome segregation ATPase